MNTQAQDHVDTEVFTEYGFGFLILLVRLAGRTVLYGFGGLAWDDLCTLVAMFFWTAEVVIIAYMGVYGNSIGLTEEASVLLDEVTKNDYRVGDKLNFASWNAYIVLIWSMKGIIIFNYHRLTRRLWQNKLNKGVGWITLACFAFCVVFQFSNCTPIQRAWRVVPVAGDKCTFRSLNYIIFTCLSILMDSAIMAVSLHVLAQARLPAYRKLLLCGVLGSGVFIITASILRSVYSLRPPQQDLRLAVRWSSREYLVTALACSAPGIVGLFNRQLWQLRRESRAPRETQHRVFGWPGTGFVVARDDEMGGHAASIGPPRPVSLQGLCNRSMRTSVASSAAPSELPSKPSGLEEVTRDLPLDDEERGAGFA